MGTVLMKKRGRLTPVGGDNSVEYDDETLVAAARNGSPAAFEKLVERYKCRVFRVARTFTQNLEDAEEIMQDAFVQAFRNLSYFRGDSRFYTWLVRITINAGLMKLRRRRLHLLSIDDHLDGDDSVLLRALRDCGPTPEHRYFQQELRNILAASIGQLRPVYRTVFELRDIKGFSTEETSRALNISLTAVKSRLLRARLQLRRDIARHRLNPSLTDELPLSEHQSIATTGDAPRGQFGQYPCWQEKSSDV